MVGIYEIKNLLSGKRYLGSSARIDRRLRDHRSLLMRGKHHCIYLQRAWDHHGGDNFIFRPLAVLEKSKQLFIEQRMLDHVRKVGEKTYNVALNAYAPRLGLKGRPETIAKLIALRNTPQWKVAQSKRTKEYFENNLDARINLAKAITPEIQKTLIEASRKAREGNQAYRDQISATLKGRSLTDEHKQAIAAGSKKVFSDFKVRERHKAGIKAAGPKWNQKLTMAQAEAIRAIYPNRSTIALAKDFGVSKKTILNILHNRIFQ